MIKMKQEKSKTTLSKMWHDKKGKAILKLGIWFLFFIIMAFVMMITSIFSKPISNKENEIPKDPEITEFLNIDKMWDTLIISNYEYNYQIKEKSTMDTIIYQGKIDNNINTGYKESKLGIIKYRIEENHIYQILVDNEEEITNLYDIEDQEYLILSSILEKLKMLQPTETKNGTMRSLTYLWDDVTIVVNTTLSSISQIRIDTPQKEYNLSFVIDSDNNNETTK